MPYITEFEKNVRETVNKLGGWHNAHGHIDRSSIQKDDYFSHAGMNPWDVSTYPLPVKQSTTGKVHEGLAYKKENIHGRCYNLLELMAGEYDYKRFDTFVDTTADIGLVALEVLLDLKKEFASKIDLRLGAYPIFGFKDSQPKRWDVFVDAVEKADFIGTLPERDNRQGHIGFKEHFRRLFKLGNDLNKDIQMHVDQTNHPKERGTFTLIEAVDWLRPYYDNGEYNEPTVWAVHVLSPSSYNEKEFNKLVKGLKKCNVGVIVCPRATISNKQDRNVLVPMHNSIARILDFLLEDVPVRIGTDNIDDPLIPSGHPDMFKEIEYGADALRFHKKPEVWAKIGAGVRLNEVDKEHIRIALK